MHLPVPVVYTVPQKPLLRDSASEQVSSPSQIETTSSSREGNNTHKLGLSPDPVPNVTTGMEWCGDEMWDHDTVHYAV